MYCTQCGSKHDKQDRFCGSCGYAISSFAETKNGRQIVSRTANSNELATYSRKIKKELSGLPLITLIGDSVKGASGLHELQEELRQNPKSPLLWMNYYEATMTFNKISRGTSVARMIYNPVGYTVSKGVASGLNAADDKYESFDPKRCLLQAIALCIEEMEKKHTNAEQQVVLGKSLYYLGLNCSIPEAKMKYFERAIKSINLSLVMNKSERHQAEVLFYLSQAYQAVGNRALQLRSLNLSRKLGFKPGHEILLKEFRNEGIDVAYLTSNLPKKEWITQYRYTYTRNWDKRLDQSLEYVIEAQREKLENTTNRIIRFFNS